jgi:hypothetical protein
VNNGCPRPLSCPLGCARQRLRVGSSPPLTLLVQETEHCSRMYVRSSYDFDPARESRKRCQDGSVAAGAEAGTALKGTRPWWQWHHSDDCSYMIGRCRLLLCIMRTRPTFQRGVPPGAPHAACPEDVLYKPGLDPDKDRRANPNHPSTLTIHIFLPTQRVTYNQDTPGRTNW